MVTVVQYWQMYHHIRRRKFLWFGKSCCHPACNLHPSFPGEMCMTYVLHRLKYSAYSVMIPESFLSPDCYINPWSFFSFFYSCIECFPQTVASSLNNCLSHPPPCHQSNDGHLSNLLQKVNTEKKDFIKYTMCLEVTAMY